MFVLEALRIFNLSFCPLACLPTHSPVRHSVCLAVHSALRPFQFPSLSCLFFPRLPAKGARQLDCGYRSFSPHSFGTTTTYTAQGRILGRDWCMFTILGRLRSPQIRQCGPISYARRGMHLRIYVLSTIDAVVLVIKRFELA